MSEGKLRRSRVLERTLSFESLEERRVMASLPFGATAEDTGEFMLGRVAVTPVLLESDGTIDPSTENWTPSHVAAVMNNVQTGLNWWTQLLQKESSVHTLEWVIDRSYADNRPSTPYEPINRTSNAYELWVSQFLSDIGFNQTNNLESNIRRFNDSQRQKLNADWSFTMFVVNSVNDGSGTFAPGGDFSRAFAFAGGLFMVVPSVRPASTFTHETGHMFWARDEYSGGGTYYDKRGYYDAQNTNAIDSNPIPGFQQQPSIMSSGASLDTAYNSITSPDATLAQIGWRDSDSDGIFDVLDVPLSLEGTGRYDALGGDYLFSGVATVQTLPNRNSSGLQNNITINKVTRVEYRIGSGTWTTVASPNSFTANLELAIPIAGSDLGKTIEIRAVDSRIGITSNVFSGVIGNVPDTTTRHGIQGFVWRDSNQDRQWNASEIGFAGATVTLVDANLTPVSLQKTIDPDNYPSGTLSGNLGGVRLDVVGFDATGTIGVFDDSAASTGSKIFKPYSFWSKKYLDAFRDQDLQLRARFDTLTSYVSIDAIAVADNSKVRLEAYAADGTLLARFERKGLLRNETVKMEVETGEAKISYVIARGFQNTTVKFDNLRFGPGNTATTAADGSYFLENLPAGNYRLLVTDTNAGFKVTNAINGVLEVAYGSNRSVTHVDFGGYVEPSPWQNQALPEDVDGKDGVNPLDVLVLVNDINQNQPRSLVGSPINPPPYLDVNGDRYVSPLDVLAVINYINRNRGGSGSGSGGEGERSSVPIITEPVHSNETAPRLVSFASGRSNSLPTTWIVEQTGSAILSQGPDRCGCPTCMAFETAVTMAGETEQSDMYLFQAPLEDRDDAALRDLFFSGFDGN